MKIIILILLLFLLTPINLSADTQIIKDTWNYLLTKNNIQKTSNKYTIINKYSKYLSDAIIYYQNNGVYFNNKLIKLPKTDNIFYLMAVTVYYESALEPKAESKFNAVGLLQVKGHAKFVYTKQQIKNNPMLGIYLGMRWFTISHSMCKSKYNIEYMKYWIPAMSVYMAGIGNSKCNPIKGANFRIYKANKIKQKLKKS